MLMSLHSKPDPVRYREYQCVLFYLTGVHSFPQTRHSVSELKSYKGKNRRGRLIRLTDDIHGVKIAGNTFFCVAFFVS